MKFDLRVRSILNILFFLIALTIYFLPNFFDKDIHRILLSKLNIFVFYPCLTICLLLSLLNIYVNRNIKVYIYLNSIVLLALIIFFLKIIYVVFFKNI